ncbi:MAG: TfuA-related McrA-glycine thioamidation protein [Candidatus Methanomethyliaceae archaeon]|nr:TfuA-related McrA-glycine thioamidation protein [Candidatus Methanomethyliaceae archaeon]
MKVVVFLGPSVSHQEAREILSEAEYRQPAGRGDVVRAANDGADAIGLIDGVFYQQAAVSHREILYAIKKGVTVMGGSSMGALRASELDGYGMVGVGKIYRWYKEGVINSDDEVALVFNPVTFAPITEPLVNIRATLEGLLKRQAVDDEECEMVLKAARAVPFQLRNFQRIVQRAVIDGLDRGRAGIVLDSMMAERVDQKRLDAIEVLKKLKELFST